MRVVKALAVLVVLAATGFFVGKPWYERHAVETALGPFLATSTESLAQVLALAPEAVTGRLSTEQLGALRAAEASLTRQYEDGRRYTRDHPALLTTASDASVVAAIAYLLAAEETAKAVRALAEARPEWLDAGVAYQAAANLAAKTQRDQGLSDDVIHLDRAIELRSQEAERHYADARAAMDAAANHLESFQARAAQIYPHKLLVAHDAVTAFSQVNAKLKTDGGKA